MAHMAGKGDQVGYTTYLQEIFEVVYPVNLEDTQPSFAVSQKAEVAPPPRWLFYGVIVFSLAIVITPVLGVIVFKDILRPSQQQRVINNVPFMANFLPYQPDVDSMVPTAISAEQHMSASQLLLISTETPTATYTLIPSVTPTNPVTETPIGQFELVEPTSTALPTATPISTTELPILSDQVPPSARLFGFSFEQQTWNNCGPASITIALSYFGWQEDQEYARLQLRPDREDKNVTPGEMVDFVNENTGIRAMWRNGGTLDLLRELVSNEFPVILGTGFMPEAYDWIGHYRTVVAYDSAYFYFYDSFMGTGTDNQGYALLANEVDQNWQHFNRRFIVLYTPDREQTLLDVLGEYADPSRANEITLGIAQKEARANPQNAYAWFNLGTSLTHLQRYDEAAVAFDQSRQANLPWRMLWYQFEPYQTYYETERYDDVLSLVQSNLNNGGQYVEETYYWKGMVHEAQGDLTEARLAYQQALKLNVNFVEAQEAFARITS